MQTLGFCAQPTHARVVGSHTGRAPGQSLLTRHSAQVPAFGLQKGRAPPQREVFAVEHSLQRPASVPPALHAGDAASAHAVGFAVQGWQVLLVTSQKGRAPEQSALDRHSTHAPAVSSHRAKPSDAQARVSVGVHCAQRPTRGPAVRHAGSAGSTQARAGSTPQGAQR